MKQNQFSHDIPDLTTFLETLSSSFRGPLFRYFEVSLLNHEDAQDCAHEVIIRMAKYHEAYITGDVSSLERLVFVIARRLAIDINRQTKKHQVKSLDTLEADHSDGEQTGSFKSSTIRGPRESLIKKEQSKLVRQALLQLDDLTREVIVLRHMENISSADVANILSIPEGTVWSRLHRGLDQLREILKAQHLSTPTTTTTHQRKVVENG